MLLGRGKPRAKKHVTGQKARKKGKLGLCERQVQQTTGRVWGDCRVLRLESEGAKETGLQRE